MPTSWFSRMMIRLDLIDNVRLNSLGRLIKQQNPGVGGERTGDRKLLLLAARQQSAQPFEISVRYGNSSTNQVRDHAPAVTTGERAHQDVFPYGEIRNDLPPLRHIGDAGARPAVVGCLPDLLARQV